MASTVDLTKTEHSGSDGADANDEMKIAIQNSLRESQAGTDSQTDQPKGVIRPRANATVDSYTKHLGPETGNFFLFIEYLAILGKLFRHFYCVS